MISQLTSYINKNKLFKPADKLLVAVSGGADSITLCWLLINAGYHFSVAHGNFMLRGPEADGDEDFVAAFCKKNKINFFSKIFTTAKYADNKGISIQMAARELRYKWFTELLVEHHFDYLLTAHHANDNIETFFINLLRGTGINGLKAMTPKKDRIVRPLLFATRHEIENYIKENKISFREDSSNKEEKYLRNQLRLQIIPALKKLNPSFEKTITNEIAIFQQTNLILKKEVEKQRKKLFIYEEGIIKIDIKKLEKITASQLILFELLTEFNFNSSQIENVYNSMERQAGKVFTSNTHTIIKDRNFLLIKALSTKSIQEFIINKEDTEIKKPIQLKIYFTQGNIHSIAKKNFNANTAFLDADKITFPLTVNQWQQGDKFKPLGMTGFKKVSDFFIAEKFSLFQKQTQYIMRSNNGIVWLIGKRTDDRFKVTTSTKKILVITFNAV